MLRVLANDSELPAGSHGMKWDGRDDAGRELPSGVYFYRLRTTGYDETRKMVMLR